MYKSLKRGIDLLFSVIIGVVLIPLMLIIAAAIKLDSPGSVIFRQERLGYDGKTFEILKFRTMCVGAENMGTGQYSFKGDKRVTKIGNILRLTSLDELPQIINIIKGEMSFIGPRPTLTYHPWPIEKYSTEQKKRFSVRPGITGLAQVNGRKEIDWNERIKYDVYYVEHLSIGMDIDVLCKTIFKVVSMQDNQNKGKTSTESVDKSGVKSNAETDVYNK